MTQAPVLLPQFALTVRGYDRQQVDDYVARLVRDLDEAHARAVAAERALRQAGVAPAAAPTAAEPRTADAPQGLRDGDGGPGAQRLPLAGLAGTTTPPARGRTAALAAAGVLALGAGAGVAVGTQDDAPPRTAPPAAPAAGSGSAAPEPGTAPDLAAAASAVEQRGDRAGSAAGALRGALRRLQALEGLERQARGLSLAGDVERAVVAGELTPETQALVRPALLAETQVDDVPELASVLALRPAAAGPEGPALLRGLRALAAAPSPQQAQALAAQVRSASEGGRLTTAARDVALPVLERAAR